MEKQFLRIGLLNSDPGWLLVMDYLGVDHAEADLSKDLLVNYSLIIVNSKTSHEEQKLLLDYVRRGGAIVETFGNEFYYQKMIHSKFKRQIYDRSDDKDMKLIPYLDLYSAVHTHEDQEYFDGLIHFKSKGKGSVGFAGFDLPALINDMNFKRKRFISHRLPFPDELVSKVSKGYLLTLFRILLQKLHFSRDLPFIFKHHSRNNRPFFAFRIDTDFGEPDSIQSLMDLSSKSGIPFTWFLHVKAHQDWLELFKKDPKQELALHSYNHATSDDISKITKDLNKAQQVLQENNISFEGFAAPYGIYNNAIKIAVSQLPVSYSSEFSFLYDACPLNTIDTDRWQIPVHPVCTGSMSRLRYTADDMKVYFQNKITEHINHQTPLIFYHHPLQKGLKIWTELLCGPVKSEFIPITMSDLRSWFQKRNQSGFSALVKNDSIKIECDPKEDICLNISRSVREFDLLKFKDRTVSRNISTSYKLKPAYLPANIDVKKNRRTDIQMIKTGIIDSRNRKYL